MANSHFIPPFPSDINQNYFGAWLSGFIDGEGCFFLRSLRMSSSWWVRTSELRIALRDDDFPILQSIQSYFQCGKIQHNKQHRNHRPAVTFIIGRTSNLVEKVIPHFKKFPLLAKKRRDYLIWEEATFLLWKIRKRRTRPKWTKEETEHFSSLTATIRNQRKYHSPTLPIPQIPDTPTMFDDL